MSGLGHIGEIQVINELESKNFKTYMPLKDVGIDFVSEKNNIFFQIQVKTSKFQKNKYFWFDLYKSKMHYHKNIFYIFVMYIPPRRKMMGKSKNYLIIPSMDLKKLISSNSLPHKLNSPDTINLFIYPDEKLKKWEFKNKNKTLDLTTYWNNFALIK